MDIKKLTFIDLFSGIGGFRLALESFGLKCLFSSEWDKYAQITYSRNFGEIPKGDITKIKETEIPNHNILCAGFPCQPFSVSGKQLGFEDKRGNLFFEILRICKYHKPEVLLLENVKNFEKHNNGQTLKTVCELLGESGYSIFYKVLNSSHYGSPTNRARIYIVAFRKDLGVNTFDFPEPTYKVVKLIDYMEKNNLDNKYCINRKDIILNKNNLQQDRLGCSLLKPIRVGTISKGGQGERIYSPFGHTITLSAYGGGIASKTGAYYVDNIVRKLTPRECARVMGFPDTFIIPVNDSQAYKQFGNSVVVDTVKLVFNSILITLNKVDIYKNDNK